MSGIINSTGARSGVIGTTVGTPSSAAAAGSIVQTTKIYNLNSGHVYTSSASLVATGLYVTSPATTGSNYNIITFTGVGWGDTGSEGKYALYVNKNGAGYANLNTGSGTNYALFHHKFHADEYATMNFTCIDPSPSTAGTNVYEIYFKMTSSNFHLLHNGKFYAFIVQEIKV